jgi:Z1 domain.
MKTPLEESLRSALSGMTGEPAPLLKAIRFYASQAGDGVRNIERELRQHITSSPNDEVRRLLNTHLGRWDWETNAPWTGATDANTEKRRERIYDLLCIDLPLRKILNTYVPPYQGAKPVVIDDPKSVHDWYTSDFRKKHNFYWKKLREFLEKTRGIVANAVNSIEASADRILERLADPSSPDIYKARGLVVGYVQSGKTTNFTAVIAKAIDAGYRLIIVLSGTTDLLRNQTQRRLDMDLVGIENIRRGASEEDTEHDYVEDEGWPSKFISYGQQPSLLGHIDIHRLTGQEDFQSRDAGLNPLEFEFEKRDRRRPLFERENLNHTGARIAVVKKQADRLKSLCKELKNVGHAKCAEVPTLVIDDESDQASVNTINPKKVSTAKGADKTRSRINERIVEILKLLPRAQYLGYTATPFANVFVNPRDPEDIYPKDFIVSLPRPEGYMGATEFLDFEPTPPKRKSNEDAYIRDIPNKKRPEENRLLEAVDAFVLTGALKKFREHRNGIQFKHHTMLFHHSVRTGDQMAVVQELRRLWRKAGFASPGAAAVRLEQLLESDFRPVWIDRGRSLGLAFPKSYSELRPFVGEALDEIRKGITPVLMVNSAEGHDTPDFDGKTGVWKIIVGGAKLSRGYTIEGLTISYFRRRAAMQDTLMQMGRWFGYRPDYTDLVRLYIGRAEAIGKITIDLYEAFEAMCRDEEDFRAQLAMYEGKGGITPTEVPALVFNSHPRLRPASRNKMFNARITWAAFDYREPTTQASSGVGRRENAAQFKRFIRSHNIRTVKVEGREAKFSAKWTSASNRDVVSLLTKVKWDKAGDPIGAELEFLRRKLAQVDSWIFLAPQITKGSGAPWIVGATQFSCVTRKKITSGRIGVYSSPDHLKFAKWLVGGTEEEYTSALKPNSKGAILLFYPTRERLEGDAVSTGDPIMGFGIVLPRPAGQRQRIAYSV